MPVPTIIPPEWGWAYDIAVGQDWPQADEDALRRVAQAWTDAMEALLTVANGGNVAARSVNYSVQSVSSDEFNNYWSTYVDGDDSVVGQMAQQCENLATQCLAFAEQTEFIKLSIDIQLILLFIQLAIDIAAAFVTFGASTAEGVLAAFITRLTVRGFLTELIKAVLMAVLPDVITQVIMLSEGHRSSFDAGETLQAAQMGVIGGLVGAGLGAGLGKLGTTEFFDSVAGKFLSEDASKFAGGVTNAALHGALTNVGTNMVAGTVDSVENPPRDQGYADQKSGENPLIAALNGAFTGALFHTVDETSFALAGHVFDATPLTLTDSEGNQQRFTALPIGDDGTKYALFDQSHQFAGKGSVDDNGVITVSPNNGSPYSAQVLTLGDQKFGPPDAPSPAPAAPTGLASHGPQQQPPVPGTGEPVPTADHPAAVEPVSSPDQVPGTRTPPAQPVYPDTAAEQQPATGHPVYPAAEWAPSGSWQPVGDGVRIAGPGDPILDDTMAPITVENAFVIEVHGGDGRLFTDGAPVDLGSGDLAEQLRRSGDENGHLTGDGTWRLHRAGAETVELPAGHPLNPTRPELITREAEYTELAERGIWREGDHPSAQALTELFGMPERNQRLIQELVDRNKIAIDLRPSNPESAGWLEQGGVPKPEAIKAKTINTYDVMLAPDEATREALAANIGAVGFFRPAEPVDKLVLDDRGQPDHPQLLPTADLKPVWAALQKRYASLTREYQANADALSHLEDEGFFHVVNGVVYPYRAEIVNRLDVELAPDDQVRAALEGSLRTAAYFRPAEPVETPRLDENGDPTHPQLVRTGEPQGEWAALHKRYAQRMAEYLRVTDPATGLVATGKASVADGVVKPFALEPLPVNEPAYGAPTVDPMLGPPVTGDHDMLNIRGLNDLRLPRLLTVTDTDTGASIRMFEFKDAEGGLSWRAVAPEGTALKVTDFDTGQWRLMSEIVDSLGNRSLQDYHPNPDVWFERLANEPGRGGDLLIRFQAGQPPTLVHSDTPVISGRIEAPGIAGLIEGPRHNPIIEALTGKVHAGNNCLIIGDDPGLARAARAAALVSSDGAFLIKAHGRGGELFLSQDSREAVGFDPAFLQMLTEAGWRPGQPIVLASCEAGLDGGAADKLAAMLPGTTVIAAGTAVWDDRQGGLFAASETVVDGMPRPRLVANEDGDYQPDGVWKEHRSSAQASPLPASDPRVPSPPARLDPNVDYAELRGLRDFGYKGDQFGPRTPGSPLAKIADAVARHTDDATIAPDPERTGQWLLDPRVQPSLLMSPDPRRDELNVALRAYARELLDTTAADGPFKQLLADRKANADALTNTLKEKLGQSAPARIEEAESRIAAAEASIEALAPDAARLPGLEAQYKRLGDELDQTRAALARAKAEGAPSGDLNADLEKLDDDRRAVSREMVDIRHRLDAADTALKGWETRLKRAQANLAAAAKATPAAPSRVDSMLAETAAMRQNPDLGGQSVSGVERMLVHSIPVDVMWRKGGSPAGAVVEFTGGDGDYPSIRARLMDARGKVEGFDQRYAKAILDLAARPAGEPRIPASLRALAEDLYGGAEPVAAFTDNPDRWSAASRIGTFFRDAAATAVLQVAVEGARNPTALVTNLMTWHMVEAGTVPLDRALGYLNVMGPVGSAQAGRASYGFSGPIEDSATAIDRSGTTTATAITQELRTQEGLRALITEFPSVFDANGEPLPGQQNLIGVLSRMHVGQRVAEMEMRQRQIVALYAATKSREVIPEDASGVTALNNFLYGGNEPERPGKAIAQLMTELRISLGW